MSADAGGLIHVGDPIHVGGPIHVGADTGNGRGLLGSHLWAGALECARWYGKMAYTDSIMPRVCMVDRMMRLAPGEGRLQQACVTRGNGV